MNEKWIEEIKHNDGMVLLDRFFPGKSCGNPECEKRCIDFCKIALRIGALKPEEVPAVVAPQLVIPENCPACQGGEQLFMSLSCIAKFINLCLR